MHGAILPPRVNVAETHIGQHGMHHTPVPHKALQLIGSDMLRQMSEVLLNLQHAECRRGGGWACISCTHCNQQLLLSLRQQRHSRRNKGIVESGVRQVRMHPRSRQQRLVNDGDKYVNEPGCSFHQGEFVKPSTFGQWLKYKSIQAAAVGEQSALVISGNNS
jgi:hypothetical protein